MKHEAHIVRESILGYEARELAGTSRDAWTPGRRNCGLLVPAVDYPLSVDENVWFSAIDTQEISGKAGGEIFLKEHLPEWTGMNGDIWQSLDELNEFCRQAHDRMPAQYGIIAITVLTTPSLWKYLSDTFEQDQLLHLDIASPRVLSERWTLIGYDVADAARHSGLSNCFYSGTDDDDSLPYAQHLNDSHLFTNTQHAIEFCTITDVRVPAHAPFFVYGLYRVSSVEAE